MTALRKSTLLALSLLLAGAISVRAEGASAGAVAGRVLGQRLPLGSAVVYAYRMADLTLQKVSTDGQGNFRFDQLPSGLYKIIAHKAGFLPQVLLLTRSTASAYQFLELQLARRDAAANATGDDFWSVRSKIPSDVLRDLEHGPLDQLAQSLEPLSVPSAFASFRTEMEAVSGVDETSEQGRGQLKGGRVDIEGNLGQTQVELSGSFLAVDPLLGGVVESSRSDGRTQSLSLDLSRGEAGRLQLTSVTNRLSRIEGDGAAESDLEHYQVRWSQLHGERSQTEFSAQYTNESNFHRVSEFDPPDIPESSRALLVEGSYLTALGSRGTLQAGVRYRERQSDLQAIDRRRSAFASTDLSNVDVYGRGGYRLSPSVLVEYGMFSTLRDGSVSLVPKGGVVLQLGDDWQAATSATRRVYQEGEPASRTDFLPTTLKSTDLCEQGGEDCLSVIFTRRANGSQSSGDGDGADSFSVGAVHRTVTETSRLYFSDDAFDRDNSLYLVRGDRLPEFQLQVSRHLTPRIVTRLESSIASGGGGIFYAADRRHYENRVRYFVTSLDTKFQSTETGLYVAFHKLSQGLESFRYSRRDGAQLEVEKLRLMVSQNLAPLFDLGADWAVQLNFEVSRGQDLRSGRSIDEDEIVRRVLGGFAVRF